ncbi:MAG TPA: hybrid sensor histidine kinase/response regulator [Burkholderiales bacterium]|nr:hybrid sensor histidine kinase/response regulator [Burkholderiales bacterium]
MTITNPAGRPASDPARADPGLPPLIRVEQVSMLYRELPTSITGTMIGALILAGTMIGERPLPVIAAWLACVAANQAWRLVLYVRYRKTGLSRLDVDRAAVYWATGSCISGLLWGATALLFFATGHHVYQAVLTVVVFGVTAGAVPLIASHAPSFYAFVFPALIPYVAHNAAEGDTPHFILSAVTLAVMLGILSFGRNYNRMLTESLRNRFEKQALADRLAAQNVDLEHARRVAEEASRSKTQFFAAASHDLRQPLHAMGLFAAALAEKVRDPGVTSVIASINDSVRALEALFNELLDISKIDSGVIRPNLGSFAVREVLNHLRNEFFAEASAKNLRLKISDDDYVVFSDAVLIERILRNLISNAIRYTPSGEIAVELVKTNDSVRIAVRDTGIGISEQYRQKIFEEFFQVGNPGRTSKKGLGLGLSIVKRLCDMLGYPIQVSSQPGRGSTFSFEVPIGHPGIAQPSQAKVGASANAELAGRLCVVIDDEEAIVEGMKALLSGWGMTVIGSADGSDVVAAVHRAERLPDLIIADYRLTAGRNGMDVIRNLRAELDPEIPAILVTGSTTPETTAEAEAQKIAMLLKPVLPDRLREMIDAHLLRC